MKYKQMQPARQSGRIPDPTTVETVEFAHARDKAPPCQQAGQGSTEEEPMSEPVWEPWQERLFDEHAQLSQRIDRLYDFIRPATAYYSLPREDQELLVQQLELMVRYYVILGQRIFRFMRKHEP